MLRRGAREFGVELSESVLIGDRCSDVVAANAAGLRQAFLIGETEAGECGGRFVKVESLAEVERWLVEKG
jgi:D-glycero-D-manno-heptose 1,7-bisphosphate phosphatase